MPKYAEVKAELKQLYREYADCRGDGCRAEIPKSWRLTPEESKQITDDEVRATNAYFGN